MLKFRNLRADEIEVRPTDTKYNKCTLLLYKDARTDRRILDETVGPENWQCEYYEVNGATFCRVGINTENGWIWKSDCGSESNIEKEKGLASDSFKRACFRWGLGIELYSTPRIKLQAPDKWYYNDKFNMTFSVKEFKAEGENITRLKIVDKFGNVVYSLPAEEKDEREYVEDTEERDDNVATVLDDLSNFCGKIKKTDGVDKRHLVDFYHYYADKIKFEGFQPRSFKALWTKWETSPNRKTDDERRSKLTKIADNE